MVDGGRGRLAAQCAPRADSQGPNTLYRQGAVECSEGLRLWHTLCGYRSWSVLEEITGKAAAVAVVVEGWYFSVQDTKVCNMLAAACRTELNAYSQAAGLGVGATTWMELGESRAA